MIKTEEPVELEIQNVLRRSVATHKTEIEEFEEEITEIEQPVNTATETRKKIVIVSAYFNDSQCLMLKNAESTVDEFMLQNIKNMKADERNNGMDKTTTVIEPDHFKYCQCITKTEEDPIAGDHMLQNFTISDAAELTDGLGKKVDKDQVTCPPE